MDYKILDWSEAASLKKNAKFLRYVDFNHSTVYLLEDSSFLVTPLNPFGKSMRVKKMSLVEQFIDGKYFPDDEKNNDFYFENKYIIDNFTDHKKNLINDLIYYVLKEQDQPLREFSIEQINYIYEFLKKRKAISKYKLNFIALVGDFLIKRYQIKGLKWGLLANKQLLNPVINLILVSDEKLGIYFNVEESIFRGKSFLGIQTTIHEIENYSKKSNEIESIIKVF